MVARDDAERVHPETAAEWRAWLEANHERSRGAWLVFWKSASGRPRLSYEDAVLEALCFGWIDGQARPLDGERSMLWFTRRKAQSPWSRTNKERVAVLAREGRMRPAGREAIEAAQRNGMWTIFDDVDRLILPVELEKALDDLPSGLAAWNALTSSRRRELLAAIALAKRPETRERRIRDAVDAVR